MIMSIAHALYFTHMLGVIFYSGHSFKVDRVVGQGQSSSVLQKQDIHSDGKIYAVLEEADARTEQSGQRPGEAVANALKAWHNRKCGMVYLQSRESCASKLWRGTSAQRKECSEIELCNGISKYGFDGTLCKAWKMKMSIKNKRTHLWNAVASAWWSYQASSLTDEAAHCRAVQVGHEEEEKDSEASDEVEPAAEVPQAVAKTSARQPAKSCIDLNRSGRRDLTSVPGIGNSLAGKILGERGNGGKYASWEDLVARHRTAHINLWTTQLEPALMNNRHLFCEFGQ